MAINYDYPLEINNANEIDNQESFSNLIRHTSTLTSFGLCLEVEALPFLDKA